MHKDIPSRLPKSRSVRPVPRRQVEYILRLAQPEVLDAAGSMCQF